MISVSTLNAYQSLRLFSTAGNAAAKTMQKLSSGNRINSAADDAVGVAISEKFTYILRGIRQSVKNIELGASILQTAEEGYNAVTNLLNRARVLAIQASNDTYTSDERTQLDSEFWSCIQEIYEISNKVEFNSQKVFGDPNYAFKTRPTTTLTAAPLYTISETFKTDTPLAEMRGTVATYTRSITDKLKIGETEFDTYTPVGYSQIYSPTLINDNVYNIGTQDATVTLGTSVIPTSVDIVKQDIASTATAGIFQSQSIASTTAAGIYFSETFNRGYGSEYTQANWNIGNVLNVDGNGFLNGSVTITNKSTSAVLSEWNGINGDYEVDYNTGTITIKDNTFINNGDSLRIEYWRANDDILTTSENFIGNTVKIQYSTNGGSTWADADHHAIIDDTNTVNLKNIPSGNLGQINPTQSFLYRVNYVKTDMNEITLNETSDANAIQVKTGGVTRTAGTGAFGSNTWMFDAVDNKIIIDPGLLDDGNTSISINYVKKDSNIIALTGALPEYTYTNAMRVQIGATIRNQGTGAYGSNTWNYNSATNEITIDPNLLVGANTTVKIRYIEQGSNENIYDFDVNPYVTEGMSLKVDGAARLVNGTSFEIVGDKINLIGAGRLTVANADFAAAAPKRNFSLAYFTNASEYTDIAFSNTPLDIFPLDATNLGSEKIKLNTATTLTYNTHYLIKNDNAADLTNGVTTAKNIFAGDNIRLEYIDTAKINSKTTAAAGVGEIFFNTDSERIQINAKDNFLISSLVVTGYTAGVDYDFYNSDGTSADGIIFKQDKLKGNITNLQLKYLTGGDSEIILDFTPLDYDIGDATVRGSEKILRNGVLLNPGIDYVFISPNEFKLLGANILTKASDTLTISYLREANPDGHDGINGTADDGEDENIYTLTNVDGAVVPGSLKVYVDGTLKTEGTHYTFDNIANKVEFVKDRTNGLVGKYNTVKIEYQDTANPNKLALTKNIIDYDGNDTNTTTGSERVYIDVNGNGSYNAGDFVLTQGTHYEFINNNSEISFTAAGLIEIGNYGNPWINIDYLYTDAGYDSTEIDLTAKLNANYGNIKFDSEKIYVDKNWDGILSPAGVEELTRGADYDIDYINNTIKFKDGVLQGNQKISIQFTQDAGALGYDEDTFQLNGTPMAYADALRVWLNDTELTLGVDYNIDYNTNQVTLTGAALKGGYAFTKADDASDDTSHTIKIGYITANSFEFAKLTGAFTNPSPAPGVAGLFNVNAVGAYSGLPGVVWDADSGTYPGYSLKVEINDGTGWQTAARDDSGINGWEFITTQTDKTTNWLNPLTGTNFRSEIDLYKNEIELNGTQLLIAQKSAQNQVRITYTYDFFEEYMVPTHPAKSEIRNLNVTYNDSLTGQIENLNSSLINGYELITVELGVDSFGVKEQTHYLSFHGENGSVNNTINPPQVYLNYEYFSETDRDPFTTQLRVGPDSRDTKTIIINPISVYGMGLADLSIATKESAQNAIQKIDEALFYISESLTSIGAQTASIMKKYDTLMRQYEYTDTSLAVIKAADMAENAVEYYKSKLLQAKSLNVFNYSNLRRLTPTAVVNKFYNT